MQDTYAFAEIRVRTICFGLWCAKNGVLNQFSFLFIEIPLRDSLLASQARTKIKSQDPQEAAVGAVSAVSAAGVEINSPSLPIHLRGQQ